MDSLVDLADVQRLIAIVQRHGLDGVTVTDDEVEIAITAQPPAEPLTELPAPRGREEIEGPSPYFQLKSPITGVFYRSAGPNDPVYVKDGDTVDETDVVCLIEAMKIFNEITAGIHGKLVRVLAANEQLVVTGEVLMEFEPSDGSA